MEPTNISVEQLIDHLAKYIGSYCTVGCYDTGKENGLIIFDPRGKAVQTIVAEK